MSLNTRGEKDNINGFQLCSKKFYAFKEESQGLFQGRSQGIALGRSQDLYDSWILEF